MAVEKCPHCDTDLLATPGILIELPRVYDGALYKMCPACRGAWHTWKPEHGYRYEEAELWVGMANMHAGVAEPKEHDRG